MFLFGHLSRSFALQFKLYGNHCCRFSTVPFVHLSLLLGIDVDVLGGNEVNIGDLDAKYRHDFNKHYSCMSCGLIWPLVLYE